MLKYTPEVKDMELSELTNFLKNIKEGEEIDFSGYIINAGFKETIFDHGITIYNDDKEYIESLSDEFYNSPVETCNSELKPYEILVIIENSKERKKLHYDYFKAENYSPIIFDSTNIVGCINGNDLSFEYNLESAIKIEKPFIPTLEKNN